MFAPILLALSQFDDRAFLRAILQSVLWSLLAFILLAGALGWGGHLAVGAVEYGRTHSWLGWIVSGLGVGLAGVAALFLFLPLATAIATLFSDSIAAAVEAQFYPGLPPPHPAPVVQQTHDAIALGLRVLGMQVVALVLTLILPGPGVVLGWAVAAWAIGRGLYVTVAMRRLDRPAAIASYEARRFPALVLGAVIAAAGMLPLLNLFAAILGVAAMVHLLHHEAGTPARTGL